MQAEEALKNSGSGAIVADTFRGLVVIRQRPEPQQPISFNVLFVSHDEQGRHDGSEIITLGTYDDLDIAVTIAAVRFGISDEGWAATNPSASAILGQILVRNAPVDVSLLARKSFEP